MNLKEIEKLIAFEMKRHNAWLVDMSKKQKAEDALHNDRIKHLQTLLQDAINQKNPKKISFKKLNEELKKYL